MTDTNYPSATENTPVPPVKNNNTKNIIIGILAAGLLGTWGYLLWDKNKSTDKISAQQTQISSLDSSKTEIQMEFDNALARLDSVTGANNDLQGQLADRQKDIEAKKAEIRKILNDKNASQSQLAKAKTMIGELNDKINTLQAEVTRLTGENQELTTANTTLKQEKSDLEQNLVVTKTEKESLEKTVDVGSTFSASNIQVVPVNEKKSGKEKNTTTAKRVDKLVVSFDVENRIAKSGPADMYLIVTAPDGKVISEGPTVLNTRTDGDKTFTAKIPVNYEQGTRKSVQFPIQQNEFSTGDYKVEIYHNGFKIGEGVRSLKKGGLFG
jgi:predicted  nucleic acid-binding Zn-ribbon protein